MTTDKTPATAGTIEIRKNKLGWGGVVKFTTRPYAAFVDGVDLKTASGATRTFSSRQSAQKAAAQYVASMEGARP